MASMASIDDRKCPFCPFKSHALTNHRGIVNRHIKREGEKVPEYRIEGHPAADSDEYKQLMSQRGCFDRAKDEDEKDERRAATQWKYREKVKLADEKLLNKKIREAFHGLEYDSFEKALC
jgi:hypothetical protein